MDNQSNNNRPQLKKIKRPINRISPISEGQHVSYEANPFASVAQSQAPQQLPIDNYLDEPQLPSRSVNQQTFVNEPKKQINFIEEENFENDEYDYNQNSLSDIPKWLNTKIFILMVFVCLFVGIIAGKIIFAESKVIRNGLQGVIVNNEVPRGRARCGVAERGQGCVLYIMNPQRQEIPAKDFYDLAAQVTGRQRFMIETGNMHYANTRIRPGDIAQLNIPPL